MDETLDQVKFRKEHLDELYQRGQTFFEKCQGVGLNFSFFTSCLN